MTVTVRTADVPDAVLALAGLDPIHYAEAFRFETPAIRSPLEWSRLILEGAPPIKRLQMRAVWTGLGIRLAMPFSSGQVLGWRIRQSGADAVVLGVRAAIGLTARLVIRAEPGQVTQSMLVRIDRDRARGVWDRLAPRHRHFLTELLDRDDLRAPTG
ncbi:hypothetical protein [Actinoplanes friuliensis]|uniref:Polyketide cyclase / dehydrase and lipid transport n=1 Tax=Actinoplanes friuliensis DSM 7358 TaxID=1246995 RepID=U5VS19_9ACTN|nr:hypothetical protein [Actinoplanes friuliensis]AGZ39582.1 hypothetical protein AFR_06465 [Actinoplanes friuliensis DSM 7358]